MNLTTPPPGRLSDLLELAIADARRLDRACYTPMWMTWHRPRRSDGRCMVCLAGAVVAGTLGCPIETSIEIATSDSADPQSTTITDEKWRRALWALDSAREGDWLDAFRALYDTHPEGELYDAVEAIPAPDHIEFNDWDKLDTHLESLAGCAEQLRKLGPVDSARQRTTERDAPMTTTTAAAPETTDQTLRRVRYITNIDRIEGLTAAERRALAPVAGKYAFRLNDYYLDLIDWSDPDDPIRQLVIPRGEELDDYGALDASDEGANTVARGVQHKYADTALLLCNEVCGAYCRYCFRKRLFMDGNDDANNDVGEGLDYIRTQPGISNVLLTGGDPLLMSTRRIAEILEALAGIEHVRIIRIGSKMPAFDPWRLRRDPGLQRVLRDHPRERQRVYLMAHFDHPRELTAEALAELGAWHEAGVTTVNQCPLIKGVNDDPNVLAELWSRLSYAGCPPYYLFQGRPTAGNAPYEVPIVEGWRIFQQALTRGSGLARRARFVMSHASGKVEVLAVDRSSIYLRYHQAKVPADLGRFLVAERDDAAGWLDELRTRDWTSADLPEQSATPAPPWQQPRPLLAAGSPLQLNDLGRKVAADIRADDWAAEIAPSLAERTADEPPYKVDALCGDYVDRFLHEDMRDRIAETAYKRGIEPEGVRAVLRVVLRNRLLADRLGQPDAAAAENGEQTGAGSRT